MFIHVTIDYRHIQKKQKLFIFMDTIDSLKPQDTLGQSENINPQLDWSHELAAQIARSIVDQKPINREQQLESQLTKQKSENTNLSYDLYHDHLTGLPNAVWFQKELTNAIEDHPQEVAVLFIDLDNFKTINDTEGHAAGDEHLRQLAAHILLDNVRTSEWHTQMAEKRHSAEMEDVIGTGEFELKRQGAARLHGDEFAVLLVGVKDPAVLDLIINRIQGSLSAAKIAASIGGKIHDKGESPEELLKAADDEMYRQKEARKEQARLKKLNDLANSQEAPSFS
jgi:GGDEF domain-containing protein